MAGRPVQAAGCNQGLVGLQPYDLHAAAGGTPFELREDDAPSEAAPGRGDPHTLDLHRIVTVERGAPQPIGRLAAAPAAALPQVR